MKRNLFVVGLSIFIALVSFFFGQNYRAEKPQSENMLKMTFAGVEKHTIGLDEAREIIRKYHKRPEYLKTATKNQHLHGGSFERGVFEKILSQPGCSAIRYYFAQHPDSTVGIVLVGVDSVGKDMTRMMIAERQTGCPPYCDSQSELLR